jgi:hypothetical protein
VNTKTPIVLADIIAEDRSGGPLAFRAEDAFKKIGIGRTTGWAEIRSGRLRSFRVGKRRLVPATAISEFIADRLADELEEDPS